MKKEEIGEMIITVSMIMSIISFAVAVYTMLNSVDVTGIVDFFVIILVSVMFMVISAVLYVNLKYQ